jgi:hypothetical protein
MNIAGVAVGENVGAKQFAWIGKRFNCYTAVQYYCLIGSWSEGKDMFAGSSTKF